MKLKINKNMSITLVCIILGITLAWQYQSIRNNANLNTLDKQNKEELISKILNEKLNNENLKEKNLELQNKVDQFKAAIGNSSQEEELMLTEMNKYKTIAGLTTVKGKGIIVTLSKQDQDVMDDDILDVLNELRASDAQALSVNDERIIATSEVRVGGRYILVNGKQLTQPYVIKAISDPANLENALTMMGSRLERVKLYVKVNIEKSNDITIPKVRDEVIKTNLLTDVVK